ncbi:ring-cleaving dioxygenase [Chungangia koreensis]|uniref:Ring-cleaving dioxygenase n=1 Tax=Chungangia koreensis TaxID=752657 RepID=A0ABV8X6C0_9LACT
MMQIEGHHHISMVTKNARVNHDFYKKVLGLRRVKKTVNQDDPRMYHLFYGDLTGSPGTELSFFEIPNAGKTHRGTNAITRIGLFVPTFESLIYWKNRFENLQIQHEDISSYAGRDALQFEDSDGLRLVLLNLNGADVPNHWQRWTDSHIPLEHQILGMGTVEMTVANSKQLSDTLETVFGYSLAEELKEGMLYQSVKGNVFGEILVVQLDGPKEKRGKGSVHHLAIRVKDGDELRLWKERIVNAGFKVMKITDRYYFESLYFREKNGILFELATDGPGFTVDSSIEELGTVLDLPPFLENRREEIEAYLEPID